jgi:hypothetical protein
VTITKHVSDTELMADDDGRRKNGSSRERISALRTEDYFRERAARADVGKAKRILKRAGRGKPPVPGDEA